MFAKLFETDLGQILVKIDEGDNGPEIRYYFEPEGLGLCSIALQFADDEDGEAWDKADSAFQKTDEGVAMSIVKRIVDPFLQMPTS